VPALEELTLLDDRTDCERWRLITITTDAPVSARLTWTGATGVAEPADVSVARLAMASVWASTWRVVITNPGPKPARVRASVADLTYQRAVTPTLEQQFVAAPSPSAVTHTIPRWATDVRLDTTDEAMLGALVELLDSNGVVRAGVTQVRKADWIPLGLADAVRVTSAGQYRLVWRLSLS